MQFDRVLLSRQAKEYGFVRDTFEKVCRLTDVLRFMERDDLLSKCLALKGGTAINLMIFNLPRLSVDIDLDFSENLLREEMLLKRKDITDRLTKYMQAASYSLSSKSRQYHALDSFVYEYQNAANIKDNIKIEINYMLRCHVLPISRRKVMLPWLDENVSVLSVAPLEIFASKIVALLNRAAPRDLYDIHNMLRFGLFSAGEQELLKKCVMFYSAVGSDNCPEKFSFDKFTAIPQYKIKTDLLPVLRNSAYFDVKSAQAEVASYLQGLLSPTEKELAFWSAFRDKEYKPELLFDNQETVQRVASHPMAMWKCSKQRRSILQQLTKPLPENNRTFKNNHRDDMSR